ncbi:hypothetical protein HCA73_16310 [Listeria booriae]|uniref:hypothetical protein n=1 Tax=Listeria booriae TaxID=1552123 RepID=UPI00162724B2|nr:hypothetical protein [Listeria booriae]MBC1914217.1 hypothetical protein [Listeria booriae]
MINEAIFNKHASNFVYGKKTISLGVPISDFKKFKGVHYEPNGMITCTKDDVFMRLENAHTRQDEIILNPLDGEVIEGPFPYTGYIMEKKLRLHSDDHYGSLTILNNDEFKETIQYLNALKNLTLLKYKPGAFELSKGSNAITITLLSEKQKRDYLFSVPIPFLGEVGRESTLHFNVGDLFNVLNLLSEISPEVIQLHYGGSHTPMTIECGNASILLAPLSYISY